MADPYGIPKATAYSAAKNGTDGMTRAMVSELYLMGEILPLEGGRSVAF